jgi:hypothetical protein
VGRLGPEGGEQNHRQAAWSVDSLAAPRTVAAAPGEALRRHRALRLSPSGLGPIRFGMKPAQASRALGRRVSVEDGIYRCRFWQVPGVPRATQLIALNGRLATILVSQRGTATTRGVKVGDGLKRLRRRYRGRLHGGRSASLSGADRRLFASKREKGRIAFINAGTRHVIETFGECA